jgi:hypothetical protein
MPSATGEVAGSTISHAQEVRKHLRRLFSFPVFIGAMVALAAAAVTTLWDPGPVIAGRVVVEGDTWWHLAVGQRILSTHTWPSMDTYSFTMHGAPWIAYEWLGEVVMAVAARMDGIRGLAILLVLLAMTFSVLIYYYAWLRSRNVLASGFAAIAVLQVAAPVIGMRPQMLGYVFLVLSLICLERFTQGESKALWPLPLIFMVWGNAHSSFVLGFFVIGVYTACGLVEFRSHFLEAKRWNQTQRLQLLWISLLCLVAVMITPYGARPAVWPVEVITHLRLNVLIGTEWQALDFSTPYAHVFLALLMVILLAQVVSPLMYRLETLALLLFTIAETCLHARFIMFFGIILAPVLATVLSRWLPSYRQEQDHPVANTVLIGAIVFGILTFFPPTSKLQDMMDRSYPAGAVRYLRRRPGLGNMYNRDEWGGYLIWAMPERKVFIDGRNDIYEFAGILWDYATLESRPREFFGKYDIDVALFQRGDNLQTILAGLSEWTAAYCDSNSVVFVRSATYHKLAGAESQIPTKCP